MNRPERNRPTRPNRPERRRTIRRGGLLTVRIANTTTSVLLAALLALGTAACGDDDDGVTDTNLPPVADAGSDFSVTDADGLGDETVTLDGSASTDADGEISFYEWSEGANVLATGVLADVTLTVGTHTITLTVTDDLIATDTDEVVVTVDPQP